MAVKRKHRIKGEKAGDWEDFPDEGRTLYLGAKSSVCRTRLYQKGLQPEYRHLGRVHWARAELQVRPAKEAKEAFSQLTPLEFWGASSWSRELAGAILQEHVDPHPAGTVYRLTERDRAVEWLCRQYGAHLLSLAEDLGSWECVGLQLRDTIAAQQEKRGRSS
jgi:predicted Zn-dependent protease